MEINLFVFYATFSLFYKFASKMKGIVSERDLFPKNTIKKTTTFFTHDF